MTALALMFAGSSATAAITYVANRAVGAGSVDLSITTDGTLGALSAANIIDWTAVLDSGAATATIHGPSGVFLINLYGAVSPVTATATDLYFDFSSAGVAFNLQQRDDAGNVGAYCLQTFMCLVAGLNGSEQIFLRQQGVESTARQTYVGNQIFASVANTGAVPEPATWAMMIMGFGVAGSLLRRRRLVAA